jgi:hypothetical protein
MPMPFAASVTTVHEDVQQRASQEQKPGQPSQEMSPMFRDQKESADREKGYEDQVCTRGEKAACPVVMATVFHCNSPPVSRRARFSEFSANSFAADVIRRFDQDQSLGRPSAQQNLRYH